MTKVILITGASSGIGFDAAATLARQGHRVYAAARRVERMEPLKECGVVPLQMDVTDEASMEAGVRTVLAAEGRIDVLVNNAGYGYFGAIENVSMEEARRQLEVNVFGLARLCQLVLPSMREQGSGRIVNTSSVAGKTVLYFGGWYHVSKYSVEALSDALRMELKPFGIDVSMIEPGGIQTNWGLIAADHLAGNDAQGVFHASSLEACGRGPRHLQGREQPSPARPLPRRLRRRHPRLPAHDPSRPLVGRSLPPRRKSQILIIR